MALQSLEGNPQLSFSGLISFRIDWLDLLAVPRDSQESSPAPEFKSINSLALCFLYGPTPTSVHDYWENHSFYRYFRKEIEMAPRLWPVLTSKMRKPLIGKHRIEG